MKRRIFLGQMAAAMLFAAPALAQSVADQIVGQLRSQGYSKISVGRTLLGRTRIVATSPEYRREIIVNPRTGEILRDFWTALGGKPTSGSGDRIVNPGGGGNSDDGGGDDGNDGGGDDGDDGGGDDGDDDGGGDDHGGDDD